MKLKFGLNKRLTNLADGTSAGDNKLDADGNTIPELQGIDHSKLVPLLTAALREAIPLRLKRLRLKSQHLKLNNEAVNGTRTQDTDGT